MENKRRDINISKILHLQTSFDKKEPDFFDCLKNKFDSSMTAKRKTAYDSN